MNRYRVEFTTAAAKQLRKLETGHRLRILAAITTLEAEPRPNGVKRLVGEDNAWRVRIGDYRVIYEIHDDTIEVIVFRVAHRRGAYE